MLQVPLKVQRRKTGKQVSKQYRRDGLVPGVYYVKGETGIPIIANHLSLRPIIYTSETKIVSLEIEGDSSVKDCVLKEVTLDPLTDKPTHFDLVGIVAGQIMTVEVPIVLKGQAPGTKDGGVLQQNIHKVEIHCLPRNLPSHIEVSVSELKVGKSIHLKDINVPDVEFSFPGDTVIVSCLIPRIATASEVAAAAAEAALVESPAAEEQN